ncbi:hypothetical protein CBA19CS22_00560 [Caballeronia novacaledonica]|uniref:Uncharacterized protein n=1 Tax=Caballeronia novacaledonica TaxID=1544861 RepID=A0ACB5QIR4_9BURK|nr:hypothetical protein CBA19CS22_00560 [Caballeronia novacaledonica]
MRSSSSSARAAALGDDADALGSPRKWANGIALAIFESFI